MTVEQPPARIVSSEAKNYETVRWNWQSVFVDKVLDFIRFDEFVR